MQHANIYSNIWQWYFNEWREILMKQVCKQIQQNYTLKSVSIKLLVEHATICTSTICLNCITVRLIWIKFLQYNRWEFEPHANGVRYPARARSLYKMQQTKISQSVWLGQLNVVCFKHCDFAFGTNERVPEAIRIGRAWNLINDVTNGFCFL